MADATGDASNAHRAQDKHTAAIPRDDQSENAIGDHDTRTSDDDHRNSDHRNDGINDTRKGIDSNDATNRSSNSDKGVRDSGRRPPVRCAPSRQSQRWPIAAVAIALLVVVVVVAMAAAAARMRRHVMTAPAVASACRLTDCILRTGDLIITSNHNGRRGQAFADWSVPIKWVTGSPFNHVAVVYVEPLTRQLLFWEINGNGTRLATVRDLTCGRPRHDIFVRRVSPPVDTRVFERAMAVQWHHEFNFFAPAAVAARALGCGGNGAFYRRSLLGRVALNDDRMGSDDGSVHRRTCAHMVAELYHLVGVLDYDDGHRGIDPAALCAGDFAKPTPDPDVLPLARGCAFGPLVRLEW